MERDRDNVTFTHSIETLYSVDGLKFQREKYLPKIELIKKRFAGAFTGINLLDVGVGYGVFLHLLEHEHGLSNAFGMDPFPDSIEIAKRYTSARIFQGDIRDDRWPVQENYFDAVTCFDVVEHLPEPGVFFEKVKSVMRPGAVVIVTTPNRGLPYRMRSIPLIGLPDTNPTHINVQRPSYWLELAREHGFNVLEAWRGEHLTHIRLVPKMLRVACRVLRLDHRKIPLVNAFEQSFCMALEIKQ
jgi:SAM-dependent methyltransferase